MSAIIERLKSGEVSRELDGFIFKELHPDRDWEEFGGVWHSRCTDDGAAFDIPPLFTELVDEGLRVKPKGWYIQISEQGSNSWRVHLGAGNRDLGISVVAASAACAVMLAIMEARGR